MQRQPMKTLGGVTHGLPTLIQHTMGSDVPYRGTFLRHLKLFLMTIQQDPYEPDRWWFAPLLYTGAALVIAALVLA
jgi:hypothetical protein